MTNLQKKVVVRLLVAVLALLVMWMVAPWSIKPVHAGVGGIAHIPPGEWNGTQVTMGSASGGVTNPYSARVTLPTTTPDGKPIKQLQIDQVTGACNTSGGVGIQPVLQTTTQGQPSEFYPIVNENPTAPTTAYSLQGPGPDFADPGSTMTFSNGQLGSKGSSSCTLLATFSEFLTP